MLPGDVFRLGADKSVTWGIPARSPGLLTAGARLEATSESQWWKRERGTQKCGAPPRKCRLLRHLDKLRGSLTPRGLSVLGLCADTFFLLGDFTLCSLSSSTHSQLFLYHLSLYTILEQLTSLSRFSRHYSLRISLRQNLSEPFQTTLFPRRDPTTSFSSSSAGTKREPHGRDRTILPSLHIPTVMTYPSTARAACGPGEGIRR